LLHAGFVFPELRLNFQSVEGGVENALKGFGQGFQLVVLPFALTMGFDETDATKVGEVAGDARLVDIEGAVQEANTNLSFTHEIEQTKAVHIRESGEKEGGLIIHGDSYTA
jgi:hypothetical protein